MPVSQVFRLIGYVPLLSVELGTRLWVAKVLEDEVGHVWWPLVFFYHFVNRESTPYKSLKTWCKTKKKAWKRVFEEVYGMDVELCLCTRVGSQRILDGRLTSTFAWMIIFLFQLSQYDRLGKQQYFENVAGMIDLLWMKLCGQLSTNIVVLGETFLVVNGCINVVSVFERLGISSPYLLELWSSFRGLPAINWDGTVSLAMVIMFLARLNCEHRKYWFLYNVDGFRQLMVTLVKSASDRMDGAVRACAVQNPPDGAILQFTYGSEKSGWKLTKTDRQCRVAAVKDIQHLNQHTAWSLRLENCMYMVKLREAWVYHRKAAFLVRAIEK